MTIKQTFTGSSLSKFGWGKNEFLWLVSVWVAVIIWSYLWSSIVPIIVLAVLSIISIAIRLPVFESKTCIKISDDTLSIHGEDAVLWKTQLKDITSIELEERERLFTKATNKVLLISNSKNDSYLLPLDGMKFEGLNPNELTEKLNESIR